MYDFNNNYIKRSCSTSWIVWQQTERLVFSLVVIKIAAKQAVRKEAAEPTMKALVATWEMLAVGSSGSYEGREWC